MNAIPLDLHNLARALEGDVEGEQVRCPGPGHSRKDRSLAVKPDLKAPDGFTWSTRTAATLGTPAATSSATSSACRSGSRARVGGRSTEYIYRDAEGRPYLRVTRTPEKKFWQHKWDGSGWVKGRAAPEDPVPAARAAGGRSDRARLRL